MKYTVTDFHKDFRDEDDCLELVFNNRYGHITDCPSCTKKTTFYRVRDRKCYSCQFCGYQLHPLAGTIFHKSPTPLKLWFYAIFLFSASKNGVSAKELQRLLGVTYKTAWRMAKQIRLLMADDGEKLDGTVEVDETYIGGYRRGGVGGKGKIPVLGIVKRGGAVKAKSVEERVSHIVLNNITKNVERGSQIMSDKFGVYAKTERLGYKHLSVNHWKKEFVRNNVHTNTIEGFWGQLKRSLDGTYHSVSPKYLQNYLDEFSFRYNHRKSLNPVFLTLLGRMILKLA